MRLAVVAPESALVAAVVVVAAVAMTIKAMRASLANPAGRDESRTTKTDEFETRVWPSL